MGVFVLRLEEDKLNGLIAVGVRRDDVDLGVVPSFVWRLEVADKVSLFISSSFNGDATSTLSGII